MESGKKVQAQQISENASKIHSLGERDLCGKVRVQPLFAKNEYRNSLWSGKALRDIERRNKKLNYVATDEELFKFRDNDRRRR